MRVSEFDFILPEDLIALRPAVPRDSARLLVVREDGSLEHRTMCELPDLLHAGDTLAVNDTKVINARLHGIRAARGTGAGAAIQATLIARVSPSSFKAFARPGKRLRAGDAITFGRGLAAKIVRREGAEIELAFACEGSALDAAIAEEGEMPLPPYIASRRAPDASDRTDYQTVYASVPGSVAAPTAGLHFTGELLTRLAETNIARETLTLHVGPGTFLPVSAADTADHAMHAEWAEVTPASAAVLNARRAGGGRILAVGTTALRTLESAAGDKGAIRPFRGETSIFIVPGYPFKAVDILLTNFHLPRSTLFMLVSAFAGTETMKRAYAQAIALRYRFYSYGDACLLFRARS